MLRKLQDLKKKESGFTIVEVMIVLAIAGLIMLIVFLAIPALQRNSRNTARNSDAARVSAAVTECLANRNGAVASCDTAGEINVGTLAQLTTGPTFGTANTAPANNAYSTTGAVVTYQTVCDAAGAVASAGGSARNFTVIYQVETNINRCISG